jgi:hypothetical protein
MYFSGADIGNFTSTELAQQRWTPLESWSFAAAHEAIRSARWMSLGSASLRNNRAGYK